MKRLTNNRKGVTIAEILVTAALLGLALELVVSALWMLNRSKAGLLARSEPRQQLRAFVNTLKSDFRMASYIYPKRKSPYHVLGSEVYTPEVDESASENLKNNGVIFAVPEVGTSDADPADPIRFSVATTYKVCYAFVRARQAQPKDERNPNAFEAVYLSIGDVPPQGGTYLPGGIDPATLTGGSLRVFDTYIDKAEGFNVKLLSSGHAARFIIKFKRVSERGDTSEQKLITTIAMRNGI